MYVSISVSLIDMNSILNNIFTSFYWSLQNAMQFLLDIIDKEGLI